MPLTLSTEAYPGTFTGRVTSIASAADPRSRVFDVEVTFPNPGLRLKPGMIVAIQLAGAHAAADPSPTVPLSAIVRSKTSAERLLGLRRRRSGRGQGDFESSRGHAGRRLKRQHYRQLRSAGG